MGRREVSEEAYLLLEDAHAKLPVGTCRWTAREADPAPGLPWPLVGEGWQVAIAAAEVCHVAAVAIVGVTLLAGAVLVVVDPAAQTAATAVSVPTPVAAAAATVRAATAPPARGTAGVLGLSRDLLGAIHAVAAAVAA